MSRLLPLLLLASSSNTAASDTVSSTMQHHQHRILHNAETGTIIHPLVPHKEHLARRRRELRELHDNELDLSLPPRPHTSRHSSDASVIMNSIGVGGSSLRGRQLQQQMGALYQGEKI